MREELIIDGQQVDLGSETSITLEYVSNLLNDPGKISLSHSYTLKLPRTANNARILDLPEIPAHDSSKTRRYLPALYLRNGINLIGDNAHAYITSATDEQYELVLVWDDIPELRALAESDATINDLPGLPHILWKGGTFAAETDGALFAKYVSTTRVEPVLGANGGPSAQMSPVMRMRPLLQGILERAGVDYQAPADALADMNNLVILASGKQTTEELNELAGYNSKRIYIRVTYQENSTGDIDASIGWQSYSSTSLDVYKINMGSDRFRVPLTKMRLRIDIKTTKGSALDFSNAYFSAVLLHEDTQTPIANIPFQSQGDDYVCQYDNYIEVDQDKLGGTLWVMLFCGVPAPPINEGVYVLEDTLQNPDGSDMLMIYAIGGELTQETGAGYYPIEGNLPDITQWDFVKSVCSLYGLTAMVRQKKLVLFRVTEDVANAVDWTDKLTGSWVVKPQLDSAWARENVFKFEENPDWPKDEPDANFSLQIHDETIKSSRDWITFPFSASYQGRAIQYSATWDGKSWGYTEEDIEPRFFRYDSATQSLQFTPDLYGEGLKAKYAALQAAIEKPVVIEATVRLTEIDLATLDLTRPVYLAQFGRYYHILKVQTGKTDDCKVELLQLR